MQKPIRDMNHKIFPLVHSTRFWNNRLGKILSHITWEKNHPLYKPSIIWFCLRCLEKDKHIFPNGGLMVINHGTEVKITLNTSKLYNPSITMDVF